MQKIYITTNKNNQLHQDTLTPQEMGHTDKSWDELDFNAQQFSIQACLWASNASTLSSITPNYHQKTKS